VVFFDPTRAANMPFIRQRMGQLLSKSRLMAAQFAALFADGLWLRLASHANGMAARLAAEIEHAPSARLAFPAEANEVFAIMAKDAAGKAMKAGATFYEWPADALAPDQRPGRGEGLYRLVTSFRTGAAEVERFAALLR
jgi:threonine aldolase